MNQSLYSFGLSLVVISSMTSATHSAVRIDWKLELGKTYKVETHQALKQEFNGKVIDRQTKLDASWIVNNINDVGNARVDSKVNRVQASVQVDSQPPTKFDSDVKEKVTGTAGYLAESFATLLDRTGAFELSKQGVVVAPIVETKNSNDEKPRTAAPPTTIVGLVFPDKELSIEESWQVKTESMLAATNVKTVSNVVFKYDGPQEIDGRSLEKISVNATITFEPQDEKTKVDIKNNKMVGVILFDSQSGVLVESKIESELQFEIQSEKKIAHKITTATEIKIRPVEVTPTVTGTQPASAE